MKDKKEQPTDTDILLENLERIMDEKRIKKRPLSDMIGDNPTYVRDLFQNRPKNPDQEKIKKIAKALGCSIDDLRGNGKRKNKLEADKRRTENLSAMDIELDVTRLKNQLMYALDTTNATVQEREHLKEEIRQASYEAIHSIFWILISNALVLMPNLKTILERELRVDYTAANGASCFSGTEEAV